MNDKELLELAAKAAGWGAIKVDHRGWFYVCTYPDPDAPEWEIWSPLDNDGDALRLAVKLEMQVEYLEFTGNARARARGMRGETDWQVEYCMGASFDRKDPEAATRRAIVRAAAEIGKSIRSVCTATPDNQGEGR